VNPCDCAIDENGVRWMLCKEHMYQSLKESAVSSLNHSTVIKLKINLVKLFRLADEDPEPIACLQSLLLTGGATPYELDEVLELYAEWGERGMPF